MAMNPLRGACVLAVVLAGAMSAVPAHGATVAHPTLAIGAAAPDFALPGVDGKTWRLADFSAVKVLVVVFTCNHCATAQAYEDRLMQLEKDYKPKGVAVVAICANDPQALRLDELCFSDISDSLDEMKIRAKQKGFNFPYLYDGETQAVAKAFGPLTTPHVFIFDAERKLRYQGRIDNSEVGTVTTTDARNAIEDLLAGRTVAVATTRVFGCSTKWAYKRDSVAVALKKWDAEPVSMEKIDAAGVAKLAKNDTGKLLLVNLWATWCGPCVAEIPDLVEMNRMYRPREFEFVTISLDDVSQKDQALKFLVKEHVSGKNYLYGLEDRDKLAEALDARWQGPVPYTMLIAPGGEVVYRHEGAIEPLEVKQAIVDWLGRTAAGRKGK